VSEELLGQITTFRIFIVFIMSVYGDIFLVVEKLYLHFTFSGINLILPNSKYCQRHNYNTYIYIRLWYCDYWDNKVSI